MKRSIRVFAILSVAVAVADCQETAETTSPDRKRWSQFRGPNASGDAGDQDGVPVQFGVGRNLLWKTALSPGASSPCIWDDNVFLTGFDKESNQLEVFCLNRIDGGIRWRRAVKTERIERVHSASTPASGTITTDGERIYAYFGSRGLLCLDNDGRNVWSIDMPPPRMRNGSGTSPIVAGNVVLLNRDLPTDPHLLAVNKLTGEVVWKHSHLFGPGMLTEGYATPIIWKQQVILHTHEGIRAIGLKEGKAAWQVNASTTGCSTPVILGNRLYVATWQNLGEPDLRGEIPTFEALKVHDADESGTIGFAEFPGTYKVFGRPEAVDEESVSLPFKMVLGMADTDQNQELSEDEWKQFSNRFSTFLTDHGLISIELGGQGNVTDTHVKVLETKNIPEVPSPLAHQGRIYLVKNGGIVSCVDAESGELVYRERVPASGSYYASPILVGDRIYLASGQGVITVLQTGDKLDVLAINDLNERILATPAVVDDTLLVRTDGHLYASKSLDVR
jgi:outer membrane protein assembly factor BamB